jgi:hypothetical protein
MSIAKGNIALNWKEFNLNLDKVCAAIKVIDSNCCGLSAASGLTVHGVEAFSPESEAAIKAYWDGLTVESEEATSYFNAAAYQAALEAKKTELETKDMATWTAVERKIFMGRAVTAEELGLI